MKLWKKLLCLNLVLLLLLTMLPPAAFALEPEAERVRTITLDLNYEGAEPYGTAQYDPETDIWSLPADPVRAGYEFSHWYYYDAYGTERTFSTWRHIDESVTVFYASWEPLTDERIVAFYSPEGVLTCSSILSSWEVSSSAPVFTELPQELLAAYAPITDLQRKGSKERLGLDCTLSQLLEGTADGDLVEVQLVCDPWPASRFVIYYGIDRWNDGLHMGDDAYYGKPYYIETVPDDATEVTLANTLTFTSRSDRVISWSYGEPYGTEYLPGDTLPWPDENAHAMVFFANYGQTDVVPIRFHHLNENRDGELSESIERELRTLGHVLGPSLLEYHPTDYYYADENYLFMGWNTKADGSGILYSPYHLVTTDMAELDLYAMLEEKPDTPHLYLCGLSRSDDYLIGADSSGRHYQILPATANADNTITLPQALFLTDNGARQIGWVCDRTNYALGQQIPLSDESMTLYAKYAFPVTLNFNFDGADPMTQEVLLPVNGYWDLDSYAPERPGCSLSEWNTKPDGSGLSVWSVNAFEDGVVPENTVLYAIWEQDKNNASVVFREGTSDKTGTQIRTSYYKASAGSLERYATLMDASPFKNSTAKYIVGFRDAAGRSHAVNATLYDLVPPGSIGDFTVRWQNFTGTQIVYYAGYGTTTSNTVYTVASVRNGSAKLLGANLFRCKDENAVLLCWRDLATNKFYSPGQTISVTASMSLEAIYGTARIAYHPNSPAGFDLTFGTYGDDGASHILYTSPYSSYRDPSYALPEDCPLLFLGWNEKPDGSGRWYNAGETITTSSPTDLYAQWQRLPEDEPYYILICQDGYTFDGPKIKLVGENEPLPQTVDGQAVFSWGTCLAGSPVTGVKSGSQLRMIPFQDTSYHAILDGNGGVDSHGRPTTPLTYALSFIISSFGGLREYLSDYGFTQENHLLLGWRAPDGTVHLPSSDTTSVLEQEGTQGSTLTLTAVWHELHEGSYILYVGNGGSDRSGALSVMQTTSPETVIANPFISQKGRFLGWNTRSDGSGIWYDPGDTANLENAKILYALWGHSRITYNLGSLSQTKIHRIGDTLPEPFISLPPDAVFRGWQDAGTGEIYSVSQPVTEDFPVHLTLNGLQYTGQEVRQALEAGKILFRANSCIRIDGVNYGQAAIFDSFSGMLPTVDDDLFLGWSLSNHNRLRDSITCLFSDTLGKDTVTKAGTAVTVTPGSTVWAITMPHVIYHSNGGTFRSDDASETVVRLMVVSFGNLELFDTDSCQKDGTNVKLWNTEPDGSGTCYQPDTTAYQQYKLELYAIYRDTPLYSVSFLSDGNGIGSKLLSTGSRYGKLPVPQKDGYLFEGWFTAETGGTEITSETVMTLSQSHTLFAHWTKGRTGVLGDRSELHWRLDETNAGLTITDPIPDGTSVVVGCYKKGKMITAQMLCGADASVALPAGTDMVQLFLLDDSNAPLCIPTTFRP